MIGGADLYNGQNYDFVADRFGNNNSAIQFNQGYLRVPPGVYFEHAEFTVIAWIKLKLYQEQTTCILYLYDEAIECFDIEIE